MGRSRVLRSTLAGIAALGVAALSIGTAPAAQADGYGNPGEGGYTLTVQANVSGGQGDPVPAGGSIGISVPPKCWWESFPADSSWPGWRTVDIEDDEAYLEWWRENVYVGGSFSAYNGSLPSPQEFKSAIRRAQNGQAVQWYSLNAQPGVNCADEGFTRSNGSGPGDWWPGSHDIPLSFIAVDGEPPAPLVDVADVTESLWDEISQLLEDPVVGRNPQITEAADATLVNLPTWFWVENTEEALAGDGEIHLEVSIPGTPVQATLDATTQGMSVSSPAGSQECSVDQALTSYASGVDEGSACTVTFDRPNLGGWPVTSSIVWTASWQGVDADGPDSGQLDAQGLSSTTDVIVVESQAVVTEVD